MHFAIILLGLLCFSCKLSIWDFSDAQSMQQDQGIYFTFLKEKTLVLKPPFSRLYLMSYSSDRNGCVSYCLIYSSCKSANFRISTGECSLFGVNSWEFEFNIISDNEHIIIQKITQPIVTHGEWTLVFRGLEHIGISAYTTYIDTSLYHDQPLSPMYPIGCLRLHTNLSCDHHFRSKLLNDWSKLNITEVKFGIYKDGVMENFVLFNGSTSTYLDWFSADRRLNSSWTDFTTSTVRDFRISGADDDKIKRHFLMQHNYDDCKTETGWFACIDKSDAYCTWGQGPKFPKFIFSKAANRVANLYMTTANIFAIFIKF